MLVEAGEWVLKRVQRPKPPFDTDAYIKALDARIAEFKTIEWQLAFTGKTHSPLDWQEMPHTVFYGE